MLDKQLPIGHTVGAALQACGTESQCCTGELRWTPSEGLCEDRLVVGAVTHHAERGDDLLQLCGSSPLAVLSAAAAPTLTALQVQQLLSSRTHSAVLRAVRALAEVPWCRK